MIVEKEPRSEGDKLHLSYAEDLEISSTNDAVQSPERARYFMIGLNNTAIKIHSLLIFKNSKF